MPEICSLINRGLLVPGISSAHYSRLFAVRIEDGHESPHHELWVLFCRDLYLLHPGLMLVPIGLHSGAQGCIQLLILGRRWCTGNPRRVGFWLFCGRRKSSYAYLFYVFRERIVDGRKGLGWQGIPGSLRDWLGGRRTSRCSVGILGTSHVVAICIPFVAGYDG